MIIALLDIINTLSLNFINHLKNNYKVFRGKSKYIMQNTVRLQSKN